ncbi:MAG: PD-(D/E)XK nuclease family protein [Usitatibacteraceae bacterium]
MSVGPTTEEMESLFVNNEQLDRIAAHLNRFNPIRTMRSENMELRHSAILAWLLDPIETHGLGDRFLKAFLAEALRGRSDLGRPTALEVSQSDLRDSVISRERENIDLMIVSPRNGWAFIVENKFHSKQHSGQLARYADRVTAMYGQADRSMMVRGLFLTLWDEEPEDQRYAPITYRAIVELLPRLIAIEGQSLGQEVTAFLHQYLDILKDATGMSEETKELADLARQLYRTHRKALDFIFEHGARTEFAVAVEALFGTDFDYGTEVNIEGAQYRYAWHNSDTLSFVPTVWHDALGGDHFEWPGCERYHGGYPLALWLRLTEDEGRETGRIRLVAEVGPMANIEGRAALIRGIESAAETGKAGSFKFQRNADGEGRRYSRFLKCKAVSLQDTSDAEEIERAMKKLLKQYGGDLEQLTPILMPLTKFADPV